MTATTFLFLLPSSSIMWPRTPVSVRGSQAAPKRQCIHSRMCQWWPLQTSAVSSFYWILLVCPCWYRTPHTWYINKVRYSTGRWYHIKNIFHAIQYTILGRSKTIMIFKMGKNMPAFALILVLIICHVLLKYLYYNITYILAWHIGEPSCLDTCTFIILIFIVTTCFDSSEKCLNWWKINRKARIIFYYFSYKLSPYKLISP